MPIHLLSDQIKKILILAFAIIQTKNVNLSEANDHISFEESGMKTEASQYNWLLKLFQTGNIEGILRSSFQLLVLYFYSGQNNVRLILDRTNWQLGKQEVNILVIGMLLEDNQTFIPLIWKDLGVSGNSDQNLRLELVDTLLHWWTALKIPVPVFEICGDREFIGEYWLKELSRRNIQYVIRLRENLTFEKWSPDADARARKSETKEKSDLIDLYKDLMIYEKQFVEIVLADEAIAHIFFVKNATKNCPNEAYIFFITNMDDIESAASFYRKRWKIELFFKHLKKAGFNLENFNMIGTHKTAILMSVLSIVYLIVYQLNQQQKEAKKILNQRNPIEWITYSNGKTYPRKSDFRIGKGLLASIKTLQSLLDICEHISEFILDKLVFLRNLHIRKLYAQ